MKLRSLLLAVAFAVPLVGTVRADDPPFPAGDSSHQLEGLKCSVVMPQDFDPAKEHSLIVILHGAGGTETGMAGALQFLAAEDFVVLAPKSTGQTWSKPDVDAVRRITADLKQRLNIGETRLHGVGFSNGGWNLAPLVFDEDLRFTSATWVAAGFNGGKAPKHAKKGMGVLAMAGSEDPNKTSAEATVPALIEKVRSAEVRIEDGLGHKWPRKLMPYYGYWLGVQEGRFVPGETLSFEWKDAAELDPILASGTGSKAGAFVYFHAPGDAESADAKALQNELLQHPGVRFFGNQLAAFKLDATDHAELFARFKLKQTPALVVIDKKGAAKKVLQGAVKAKSAASALKSVAPVKKLPK